MLCSNPRPAAILGSRFTQQALQGPTAAQCSVARRTCSMSSSTSCGSWSGTSRAASLARAVAGMMVLIPSPPNPPGERAAVRRGLQEG